LFIEILFRFLEDVAIYLSYAGIGILLISLNTLIEKQNRNLGVLSKIIGVSLLTIGLLLFTIKVLDRIYLLIFH
jgi:divalent metal cation (Fe/Co/Zn/Cd) transporter